MIDQSETLAKITGSKPKENIMANIGGFNVVKAPSGSVVGGGKPACSGPKKVQNVVNKKHSLTTKKGGKFASGGKGGKFTSGGGAAGK